MVDTFLLLALARTGDQLQGIKKGVLELADVIAVNKADGSHEKDAKAAARELAAALQLLRNPGAAWRTPVLTCSAQPGTGLHQVWESIQRHRAVLESTESWTSGAVTSRSAGPGTWSATSCGPGCTTIPRSARLLPSCSGRYETAPSRRRQPRSRFSRRSGRRRLTRCKTRGRRRGGALCSLPRRSRRPMSARAGDRRIRRWTAEIRVARRLDYLRRAGVIADDYLPHPLQYCAR